jgi:2-polyprenyl-3-methyl-5-hydroxy-6-metoxy-1,4-benzoquinol methylase/GNAT superfamily N-acetyltransferase
VNIEYKLESELYNADLFKEMSNLYSNHYGFWGKTSENFGKRIKLSPSHIRKWTKDANSYIATARDDDKLIGYAIAIQAYKNKVENTNRISWITQLVVHQDYRQHGIGKELLFSFWGFSTYYAWGIMSSNPYAIRALEKATYRRVEPAIIKKREKGLKKFGIEKVSYLDENTEFVITTKNTKVNTKFPSDISKINEKLENVTNKGIPWLLGEIEEGWEWLAFTFNDQKKIQLTKEEINEMLDISDKIAHQAYSDMQMESPDHFWSNHTTKEIEFIIKNCKLNKDTKIADFGCGVGRHANKLIEYDYDIIGIDYSQKLLKKAKQNSTKQENFITGDCRTINLEAKYNVILCLYDVIGSFIDNSENIKILNNIYNHLEDNGYALISVMNYELTKAQAKYTFSLQKEHNKLLELTASNTMQKSGDIFNPDYYMIDEDTNIVYRREQFNIENQLPRELIVRDYRYTKIEIEQMCKDVGLEIMFSRYVQAGKWEIELEATDKKAKEILILCQKLSNKT